MRVSDVDLCLGVSGENIPCVVTEVAREETGVGLDDGTSSACVGDPENSGDKFFHIATLFVWLIIVSVFLGGHSLVKSL